MIKSKIDARERALELSIAHYNGIEGNRVIDAVETAKEFESYLIGDAELPETEPSVEDVTNKAIERIMTAVYGGCSGTAMGISGTPIKDK